MICPKCDSDTLKPLADRHHNVRVESCAKCGGLWFDEDEIEETSSVAIKDLAIPFDAEKTSIGCTACDGKLYRFNYPQTNVMIGMCKSCSGVWLERNELDQIISIRKFWESEGQILERSPRTGLKEWIIRYINMAIEELA